jgi:hypothetical protein
LVSRTTPGSKTSPWRSAAVRSRSWSGFSAKWFSFRVKVGAY